MKTIKHSFSISNYSKTIKATGAMADVLLDSLNAPAKTRKDRIEMVLAESGKFGGIHEEEIQAWRRLCRELNHLTHPEAPMPKFDALLHAVWIAASNDQT